ncbi:MAG: bifunctional molybdenum cofactor biosynthesis protein MoaC/MoaB [Oceanococcus sp.]
MRNISDKPNTHRQARAEAWVHMPADCAQMVLDGTIDKGDVREAARIAGMMAIKRCWELLPHCHPIPLQHSSVEFELRDSALRIETCVATIGPTGVEMEALTGASIAALTVYDMLKPHAGMNLSIEGTKLLEKTGGKSDHKRRLHTPRPAWIITVSSDIASGGKPDAAADWLAAALGEAGFDPIQRRQIEPDTGSIRGAIQDALAQQPALIASVGGTGLSFDDCCAELMQELIEKPIPGIMEAARQFGQQRTPLALISRGVAGVTGKSLLMSLPGSRGGVEESWHAVLAGVVHAIGVINRPRKEA